MIKTSKDILNQWMRAVNNGNIQDLLGLYDDKAVMIPTFSNRLLDRKEKIKDYFEKLANKEELSIALHENTIITQNLGNNIYLLSGIYNWRFAVDGELLNFEARFSYVIDSTKSSPILHHHSSQIPRTL